MSDLIGVSFPIPKSLTDRFFERKKHVFIKPATIFKELHPGIKFFFYQSQEDTGIIGEAIIKSIIIKENPLDFFDIYCDEIFLEKQEVQQYIKNNKKWKTVQKRSRKEQRKRPWIAIELEKIVKYSSVKKISGFVPVSGVYIREDFE